MHRSIFLILIFAAAALVAAPQKPDAARHIDFTQPLVGLDSQTLTQPPSAKDEKPAQMTLGDVCVNALEIPLDSDKGMNGEQKFKLDELARRIYKNKDAVLNVEDVALLKDRVGRAYSPLVVGIAWRILDPAVGAK